MKYNDMMVLNIGKALLEHMTFRDIAKLLKIPRSTAHELAHKRLPSISPEMYLQVKSELDKRLPHRYKWRVPCDESVLDANLRMLSRMNYSDLTIPDVASALCTAQKLCREVQPSTEYYFKPVPYAEGAWGKLKAVLNNKSYNFNHRICAARVYLGVIPTIAAPIKNDGD